MNVSPRSPLATNFGLWVSPLVGVTAECRTRWLNWRARLRRAGVLIGGLAKVSPPPT